MGLRWPRDCPLRKEDQGGEDGWPGKASWRERVLAWACGGGGLHPKSSHPLFLQPPRHLADTPTP